MSGSQLSPPDERIVDDLSAVGEHPSVVCIGFFDGVHLGHQAIIGEALAQAGARGVRTVVVTFDRHPMEVVAPGSQPALLMSPIRRARTLAAQGVDLVVVLPFDDDLRHRSPGAFVDHVLVDPLRAVHVVVGANFRFGHRAAGDVDTLRTLGAGHGFTADGVALRSLDGAPVSSTAARTAVEAGDVRAAAALLGRPHTVDGVVVHGEGRGAGIGFATANVRVSRRVAVPAVGVYAGTTTIADGTRVGCVTNVGVNPTFGGQDLKVEAHLLDWSGDLYGHQVAVSFTHRLRDERRFDGVDALVAQLHRDVAAARNLLC